MFGSRARTRTTRVGPLDVEFAGTTVGVVAGPVEVWDQADLLSSVRRMAELGGTYRVGLQPRRDSSIWEAVQPDAGWLIDEGVCRTDSIEQSAADCLTTRPAGPTAVGLHDRHLLLHFDHGNGDSHVMLEQLASLTGHRARPDGFVSPAPVVNTRWPLAEAVWNSLRANPKAYVAAVAAPLRRRLSPVEGSKPGAPTESSGVEPGALRVVFVCGEPDVIADVMAERARLGKGVVSLGALLTHRITTHLRATNPRLSPKVGVLVDLRRFLGPNRVTLANLAGVANIDYVDDPVVFGGRFRSATTDPTLPGRVVASLAVKRVKAGRRRNRSIVPTDRSSALKLTVSDLTRHPSMERISWSTESEHRGLYQLCIALPPARSEHISVAVALVGGRLQLTATFDETSFDAEVVRSALTAVMQSTTDERLVDNG